MRYQDYISSLTWRSSQARLDELAAAGFRCRICNAGSDEARLEVHHRTYERLGNEDAADLTTLCRECHHSVTDFLRRRRYVARQMATADHRSDGADFRRLAELLKQRGHP